MPASTLAGDGVRIWFDERGAGTPALVFVHGWSCDRRYWDGQLSSFAEQRQVVAIDLAGHGESGLGRTEWTIESFADDVVAVVDALGLEQMVLVGHSMGGDVVTVAAVSLGARAAGVVWVDTYRALGVDDDDEAIKRFLARLRADFPAEARRFVRSMFRPASDPRLVDWVVEDMASAPVDVAVGAVSHSLRFEPRIIEILATLPVPVVAINPDYKPSDVESLRRHGVATRVMPGVSHFLMMENAVAFNRLLAETVEALSAKSQLGGTR